MAVVSVAVMAHPRRALFVEALLASLDITPEVVWDRVNNEWDTGRRALLAFDPSATHHVVVQDDALVCRDFQASATRAADAAGDRPVCFYVGKVRPHQSIVTRLHAEAQDSGSTWLQMPGPWWGVAVMLPTAHLPDLVAWGDTRGRHVANYDKRVARWYARTATACWYSVPSLVDHRPEHESPSLLPGHAGTRTAHAFIGQQASGLSVQWQATAHLPRLRTSADRRQVLLDRQEERRARREQVRALNTRRRREPTDGNTAVSERADLSPEG